VRFNILNLGAKSTQGKGLYFPLLSIIAVVLTLLVLLSISTYRHLHGSQVKMKESLLSDGQIILKSIDVSFRPGMMAMMGRLDNLQEIMDSIATLSDIRFVALLDRQGVILAASNRRLIGSSFPQKEKLRQLSGKAGYQSWFGKAGEFIVIKKLEPFRFRGMGMGMSMGRGFGMGFGTRGQAQEEDLLDRILSGQVYAVVGLGTKAFEEAQKNDLHHSLLMGLILLILGTAGFYFIFLVQDRYVAQRALDSMTTYATQVVENMPDGLLSIDPQGNIVTLNTRARKILSWKEKWSGKEEIKRQLSPFLESILIHLKEKNPILEHEVDFSDREGNTIPLSISAAQLISETGEDLGSVVILRDLREIKDLQEKIKNSERLAGLGSLAAGMAHEIRNPLSSIKGFAQYFLKKNPPGSEGQKYSQVIIQEAERLNRVISNLLDFARPKEPVKILTPLEELIRHNVDLIKDEANSKGIQVRTEIEPNIPALLVDTDQMTQVLLNITLNGLEALKEGGLLSIRAFTNKEAKNLTVEIEDNGPGMSGEELSKIFDPFFTTKKTGTGLGLAIAFRIIEKHHGSLTVRSQPGSGSIFHIELPLDDALPSEKT
jgi:two-component system, NtrC family, sensor histidine kinase HydH